MAGWPKKTFRCGYGGFNKNPNYDVVSPNDLLKAINITRDHRTWAKMQGASKVNATVVDSGARIQGLYKFPAHTTVTEADVTKNTVVSGDDCYESDNGIVKTTVIGTNYNQVKYVSDPTAVVDTGWVDFQTFSNLEAGGSDWADPSNAAASDDARARADMTGVTYSDRLKCVNPNTTIPDNSIIVGVEVVIERSATLVNEIKDFELSLFVGAAVTGDNKADTVTLWPHFTSEGSATYGGAADLWGVSLASSDIDSNFGIVLRISKAVSEIVDALVDHVQVKIYYTKPRFSSAFRFQNETVPAGASIVSALLKLVAYSSHSDVVAHGGSNYACKADHTSGAASEPGVGGSWATYWRLMASEDSTEAATSAPAAWVTATDYEGNYASDASVAMEIKGINETDADCDVFTNGIGDPPTDRPLTTASHLWTLGHLGDTFEYTSPDLYDVIQELIDNGSWASGQDLGLTLEWVTNEPEIVKQFYSHDKGTADYYPELFITYRTETATGETTLVCTGTKKLVGIASGGGHTTLKTYINYPVNNDAIAPVTIEGINAAGSKAVFVFQGVDEVQQWDGSAAITSDIANPNTDWGVGAVKWPTVGILHNGRIWAFGTLNKDHTAYYSSASDHEDYLAASGGGTVMVGPGKGERVVGGVTYMGRLYVFKYPTGIYILNDTSVDKANWRFEELSSDVGLAGPRAITPVGHADVVFVGTDGFLYSLKAAWQKGDVKHARMMADEYEEWMKTHVTLSDDLNRATLAYQSRTGLVYCLFAVKTNTYSRVALGLDLRDPGKPALLEYDRDDCETLIVDKSDVLIGATDGYIYELNDGSYNVETAAYSCEILTPPVEILGADNKACFHEIILVFEGAGQHKCNVEVFGDGKKLGDTKLIDGSTSKDILYVRRRLEGEGNNVQVRVTNSDVDTSFSLVKILIGYSVGVNKN